ncbi:glycine zipper 2TM domain-containing protein [Phenylobacterium sp. LjRoot225]|uniref:glycine zipper 2TM domain-containing protein n=1 Tax=Phenylobacterium sp. LjRoot225 TaxID=3342285 RepID=UPI003ED0AB7B
MRKTIIAKTMMAASAFAIVAAPIAAEAAPKQRHLVCDTKSAVRRNANNGTVIGAVGGGLLGNAIGKNTTGTLIGAGAGAVAGHEIAKNRAKKKCHYVYR